MRGTTNPAPVLPCITFSVARWQHRTARRPQSNQITNKLTFHPPTRLPELTKNLIRSSHSHSTPSLKISCKSVQPFSRNVADKETNKEIKKSSENNTPSPYRGRGNKESFKPFLELDRESDRHQNPIYCSLGHAPPLQENSINIRS